MEQLFKHAILRCRYCVLVWFVGFGLAPSIHLQQSSCLGFKAHPRYGLKAALVDVFLLHDQPHSLVNL